MTVENIHAHPLAWLAAPTSSDALLLPHDEGVNDLLSSLGGGEGEERPRLHLARASLDATRETALPRLLAMPASRPFSFPRFYARGAKVLFVPLALAVGFSMVASFILSSTLVPV